MTYDMNDAELPRGSDLIPDGSFVKVMMQIRKGGLDGQGEVDRGLLKGSKTAGSDAKMLDCEFTVVAGPHIRRKFWQTFTVVGGKLDENGVSIAWKISKGHFRAMIDSALGLDSQDMSEASRAKRVLRGLADLHGITFAAKVMVQPANDPRYSDSNRLDRVVLPGEPEYRRIMDGEAVPAQPSSRPSRLAPSGTASAAPPAWANPAPMATAEGKPWERPNSTMPPSAVPQAAVAPPLGGPAWLNG